MNIGSGLLIVLFLFVAGGCGKEDSSTKGSGGGTTAPVAVDAAKAPVPVAVPDAAAAKAEPASLPPELVKLEEMIAPILAMTDEDARTKRACKELDAITTQMWKVTRNPPAGVDAAAWTEVGERMAAPLNDFAIECGEGEYYGTKALAQAAETAKEFVPLLPKKPN